MRGLIPTYWYQETSVTMPKPPILLNRVDPNYLATEVCLLQLILLLVLLVLLFVVQFFLFIYSIYFNSQTLFYKSKIKLNK
jgi:hypothetical protein